MKVLVAIAHAAWDARRHAPLARLCAELAKQHATVQVFPSLVREHASVWARRLWQWVSEQDADAVICLNDDVTVHPKLVEIVEAMVHRSFTILCLHTNAPVAPSLALCGDPWLRSYWLTGPGYVLTPDCARALLRFADRCPRGFVESVNEDNLAIQFMHHTKILALHSIPALVRHDTSVPSTLGYDDHAHRQITVPWDDYGIELTDPEYWRRKHEPIYVENPWLPNATQTQIAKTLDLPRSDEVESPKIALAVVHAAHRSERKPLLVRLASQLFFSRIGGAMSDDRFAREMVVEAKLATMRGPSWVWQDETLEFFEDVAERLGATHALTLQDDVTVGPGFWPWLRDLVLARPSDVIALDCAHPAARVALSERKPGFTTSDGLIGIGHVLPSAVVTHFRKWKHEELRDGFVSRVSEDVLLSLFCMAHQIRIFHPTPTFIDHDLDAASLVGEGAYDGANYRKPQVTWKERDLFIDSPAPITREWLASPVDHVGRFYTNSHHLLPLALKDAELAAWLVERYEWECEETPKKYRRFFERVRAA